MFNPEYTVTPKIVANLTEIAQIKTIVGRSRVLPLNELALKRQATLRMAHTSTSIEGNRLAQFEVGKVIAGQSVRATEKDILEVKNYYKALKLLDKLADKTSDIAAAEILELHKTVISGLVDEKKTGKFRPADIYVVDVSRDGKETVRFTGPPASRVLVLVKELLAWLKAAKRENIHPVIRAGILHLQFVTIHPFTDGNGRVARLLTQLELYRSGWDFKKILVLEDYYNQDRLSYYKAENEVQGKKFNRDMDFTTWLEYFTTGFLVEARHVQDQIQSISFTGKSGQSGQVFLDSDELKIMDFISTNGRITSDDVVDILGLTKRSAQLKLKKLAEKELLKMEGAGPSTYYVLQQ